MDQAHEESWHMRISNKPLTAKIKLVLLVVNSVKLHLTAFKKLFKNYLLKTLRLAVSLIFNLLTQF